MGVEENKQLRWVLAIGLSVALHVLIVALMVGVGGDDSAPSPVAAPSAKPEKVEPEPQPARSQPAKPEAVKPEPPKPVKPEPVAPSYKTYTVKPGDNLSKIAKLDGSTLAELAELNETDVSTLARLKPGQVIKVRNGVE